MHFLLDIYTSLFYYNLIENSKVDMFIAIRLLEFSSKGEKDGTCEVIFIQVQEGHLLALYSFSSSIYSFIYPS